jgi:hypothetical protein
MNEQILERHKENIQTAIAITNQISPLLMGQKPEVVGSILATITATWLAGHRARQGQELARDKDKDGEQYRAMMLAHFVQTVMLMLPDIMQEADDERAQRGG